MNTVFLVVEDVTKSYVTLSGKTVKAVDRLSFCVKEGEFLTVVGPSGSGKSTLLQLLAGMEMPTSGQIKFAQEPKDRRFGFVFQANTIFPWRTVEANVTYAFELQGVDRATRKHKAGQLCQLVGLDPEVFLSKYPKELSGGEQRRVAIGMALSNQPNLLLLDEPTSQLDYLAKWNMQHMIENLWATRNFTTVLVTHDLEEAIFLGDYVLILNNGSKRGILNVNLPRPRQESLRTSNAFSQYLKQLIECQGIG